MVEAIVRARGVQASVRRSRTYQPVRTTVGMQMRVEAVEKWLRRDVIGTEGAWEAKDGRARFADLRFSWLPMRRAFRTTVVGSLPKPAWLQEKLPLNAAGKQVAYV